MERLRGAACRAVGLRAVLRALRSGTALAVYLADDADETLRHQLLCACEEAGCCLRGVPAMKALGRCCGIEVRSACAAILQPQANIRT